MNKYIKSQLHALKFNTRVSHQIVNIVKVVSHTGPWFLNGVTYIDMERKFIVSYVQFSKSCVQFAKVKQSLPKNGTLYN